MGDRCYMEIYVLKEHAPKLIEIIWGWETALEEIEKRQGGFGASVDDSGENWLKLVDDQANYGSTEGRALAAKAGCVFYGSHTSGGEYGAYTFASDGKEMHEWESGHNGHGYVIHCPTGPSSDLEMARLRDYVKLQEDVMSRFLGYEE